MEHVFTPVVVQTGLTALAAHLLLFGLFSYVLPKGPWTDLPSFTAHQVVVFPIMIYLTYSGSSEWFGISNEESKDTMNNILGINEIGSHLGEVALGMMLIWDIPVGIMTPVLRDPVKLAHHVGVAFVGGVVSGAFTKGRPVGSYYALFFLGVIEFSTIFLVLVDLFHPHNRAWFDFLKDDSGGQFKRALRSFNEVVRFTFAVAFLLVRALYFPYVQATGAIPDFFYVGSLPAEERDNVPRAVLYGVCTAATLFSILQIYWGYLVFNQVLKALGFGPSKKKKTA